MEGALGLTKRFLHVHGDEWNLECDLRRSMGPKFGVRKYRGTIPPPQALEGPAHDPRVEVEDGILTVPATCACRSPPEAGA